MRVCVVLFFLSCFVFCGFDMYVVPPPQRSDPGAGSGDLRVYQAWKGSNVSSLLGFLLFV